MAIFANGQRLIEHKFQSEEEFERVIVSERKLLFGEKSIYIDAKKKIESKSLGGVIPDGFLFNFSDIENPEFYIVEVERKIHSFSGHILPQITKFIAFYKRQDQQKKLVDKLYSVIADDSLLKAEFESIVGAPELYKLLSDTLENSQKILIVLDGEKPELHEIMNTHAETWGKMVRLVILRKYSNSTNIVYDLTPDFEILEYSADSSTEMPDDNSTAVYTEGFHLEGVSEKIKTLYGELKQIISSINSSLVFNPTKYYISVRGKKNLFYIQIRKSKIRFVFMLPEESVREIATVSQVKALSESVQHFWGGPSTSVYIQDKSALPEITELIRPILESEQE